MTEMRNNTPNPKETEVIKKTGLILIISGLSGAGKDTVAELIIENENEVDIVRLVTHTDRSQRAEEIDHYHYHFVTPEHLNELQEKGLLVENPVIYGTSRKATAKAAFDPVFEGQNLLWRIDPSRAIEVAKGEFFDRVFEPDQAEILKQRCIVLFIVADQQSLESRRKQRDGEKYDPKDYEQRDTQDQELLNEVREIIPHVITNKDGELEQTMEQIFNIIAQKLGPRDDS